MQELWTLLVAAGGVVYLGLAAMLVRNRPGPGARTVAGALVTITAWVAASLIEFRVESLDHYVLAAKAKYTAVALVPPLLLLFLLRYTERPARWRGARLALFVIPAATIAVTWTNELHEWMWAHPPLDAAGERSIRLPWGAWFWWVHIPYSYALAGLTVALIAGEMTRSSKLQREQLVVLQVGVLLPLVVNMLFTAGVIETRLGPTPLAFVVTGLLFSWGFVRRDLFRLAPVAYQTVFEHMQDGVLVVDATNRIVNLNRAALGMTRCPPDRALGHRIEDALPEDPALAAALRDVTERERSLVALRESEALVRGIVDHSPNGILRLRPVRGTDAEVRDFVCVFANPAAAAQIGRAQSELVGRPFKGVVHPHTAGLFQAFREVVNSRESCEVERSLSRGGRERWLRFLAAPAGEDLIVTCVDVTRGKNRELAMEAAAAQDSLTGLLNRRGFEADAPSLLLDTQGETRTCALLYADLDRFKEVNDRLGHDAGDLVLCEFAARMQRCTRGPDLMARLGGDEFVLLLLDTGLDGALWVAERLLTSSHQPIRVNDQDVDCTPSIGIALQPEHATELKALIQAADRAMYDAKARGGGVAIAKRVS